MQDIASLQDSLGLYMTDQAINGSVNLGNASTVYVSLPDPTATSTAGDQCQGLGLPALPASYAYHCASTSTYRNVDGTGWLPVSFKSMSQGSPLGSLPIDPVNQSSSRNYDTYTTNGTQYELTTALESSKYKLGGSNDAISEDGGTLATVYEKGTKLGLEPLDYGDPSLVGYWTFDEGTDSTAYDYSGNGNVGTWSGSTPYYAGGKVGSYAGDFGGANTVTTLSSSPPTIGSANFSIFAWITLSVSGSRYGIISYGSGTTDEGTNLYVGSNEVAFDLSGAGGPHSTAVVNNGAWHLVGMTNVGGTIQIYVDGQPSGSSQVMSPNIQSGPSLIGEDKAAYFWSGLIDDVRIYNRALSAAEIAAMYNGGK